MRKILLWSAAAVAVTLLGGCYYYPYPYPPPAYYYGYGYYPPAYYPPQQQPAADADTVTPTPGSSRTITPTPPKQN